MQTKTPLDQLIEGVICLHRFLLNEFNIRCPQARAYAVYYFRSTYHDEPIDSPENVLRAAACLHLGLKIQMAHKSVNSFVRALDNARKDSKLMAIFPAIRGLYDSDQVFLNKTVAAINKYEMQIITDIDFHLEVPLPYQYYCSFIRRILIWHISIRDRIFENVFTKLSRTAETFLNDMQQTVIFYTAPVNVVTLIAVRLAFEMFDIPLVSPCGGNIFHFLIPSISSSEFESQYTETRMYFLSKKVAFDKKLMLDQDREFDKNVMRYWRRLPLQEPPGFREGYSDPPPPPPFYLLKEISGRPDQFSILYTQHMPDCPPPDAEDSPSIGDSNPKRQFRDSRIDRRSDDRASPRYDDRVRHRDDRYERRPRPHHERPRFEDDRGRYENDRPRYESERPRFEGGRYDGERSRYDNDRGRYDGERGRPDDYHRFDDDRPRYDDDDHRRPRYERKYSAYDDPPGEDDFRQKRYDDRRVENRSPRYEDNRVPSRKIEVHRSHPKIEDMRAEHDMRPPSPSQRPDIDLSLDDITNSQRYKKKKKPAKPQSYNDPDASTPPAKSSGPKFTLNYDFT